MSDPTIRILKDTTTVINHQEVIGTVRLFKGVYLDAGNGGSDRYVHTQDIPSKVWIANHDLDCEPQALVIDSAGTKWLTQVDYPSLSQVIARFETEMTGKLILTK